MEENVGIERNRIKRRGGIIKILLETQMTASRERVSKNCQEGV